MDKDIAPDEEQSAPQKSTQEEKMDSYQPVISQAKSGRKKLIIAAVVIVVLLVIFWLAKSFLGKSPQNETQVGSQPIPTQIPTATSVPTPTPKVQLVRSEWSLEVLNGSSVTGAAKKVADKLKEMGYQVIKVGNADKDDYDSSQIFISNAFKDKVDLLVADIKDAIKIASVAGELKDSSVSARIVIGKD